MSSDLLGLTADQRLDADMRATVDDFFKTMNENYRRNRAMIEDLAPGTRVRLNLYGHPMPEMTREQILEWYF